jgi:DNA primase, catalytic core
VSGSFSDVMREIKGRIRILDLVGRYVELRRAGNRWVAPCPFHQETKPSFSVNEEEGFFYCFGCQASGDLLDFYKRINGLETREAIEQLAEEAGVEIRSVRRNPRAEAARNFKREALKMYALAARHFKVNLAGPAGAPCREYIARRKLSPEIVESFDLGWSLDAWQGLADTLQRAGFSTAQGIEAGLLAPGKNRGAYDRFRARLIFPIKDLAGGGQVIAFGGRIIGDEDAAKYINSTDSVLYKKGEHLYGLFQARHAISVKKHVLLTEGYMDVLTLHQFGYTNACAALGTALTDEQVHRLAGFCSAFELLFDGDAAGRKAALRAAEMILIRGLKCKVVLLPEKEDIDSLLQGKGVAEFEDLRAFAPDGLDFCIRTLSDQFAPKESLEWVKNFIAKVKDTELLSHYVSRLTMSLDLDEAEVRRSAAARLPAGQGAPVQGKAPVRVAGGTDSEIMKFLVRYPHHLPALRDAGALFLLTQQWARSLWEKIEKCAPEYTPDTVLRYLDEAEKQFWGRFRVMEAPPPEHEQQELQETLKSIRALCQKRQSAACVHAMRQSGATGNAIDYDLLKAANEALVKKRSRGSNDGEY